MITGFSSLRCGLIGEHLSHSFSPEIHNALADYSFVLREVSPCGLSDFIQSGELDAFCVTIPYKKAVMPLLDTISDEANAIGSVNVVVRDAEGRTQGYNTDYFGFVALLALAGICPCGKKALIIGRGGAALTAAAVLRSQGAAQVVMLGSADNTPQSIALHSDTQILVNASPVGMFPNNLVSPVDLSLLPSCVAVLDMVYNPARTALMMQAEKRGIVAVGGMTMLVAQAAKAAELFTNTPADPALIPQISAKIAYKNQNIVLVGMPGCGKTSVGAALAQRLGRRFVDSDILFAEKFGYTPADAIIQLGEDRFRELEHEVICDLGKQSGIVIATGGGVVTRQCNYAPLHQNGTIVFLRRSLSLLCREGRPLSQAGSLEDMYSARRDMYHAFADLLQDSTENIQKTAEQISDSLKARFGLT